MDKTFVCDISEEESKKLLDIYEMRNTLESLVRQIAGNNDILKEDSLLYTRLVEDYKKNMEDYDKFWVPYMEKYEGMIDENTQLSIDFRENKLFVIPKEGCIMETKNA
ncbi:MAG: CXXX repeat peptide modification system protein [Lachnospiraceae bacterium]|nr:CXXX repeat peptide modification system protein [Lachnospiraceae bacterium]